MQTRLTLDHVTVEFPIIGAATRSLKKAVVSSATGGKFAQSGRTQIVKAVNDVSLDLQPGTRLGLVGHNGAGKSTLLKTMAGIYPPTSGQVRLQGRVAPLFGLEAGMDPDATGYENIWLRGLLTGMSVDEIRKRIGEIADFSGLGKYLHMPIRTYSSGMRLRLSFSIATCQTPEILLLDEWIGAGDAEFSKQAEERMNHLVESASILVLASHNFQMIQNVCTSYIQVDAGQVSDFKPVEQLAA
jgi:ABC-type polysaccharide/polyol phosphate transport system ATPase subunit